MKRQTSKWSFGDIPVRSARFLYACVTVATFLGALVLNLHLGTNYSDYRFILGSDGRVLHERTLPWLFEAAFWLSLVSFTFGIYVLYRTASGLVADEHLPLLLVPTALLLAAQFNPRRDGRPPSGAAGFRIHPSKPCSAAPSAIL